MARKIIVNIIRILFAAVFIFSGFVKAIDPLGFTYKIEDYLTAFGPFFTSFSFLAFPVSIFMSAIEFLIGFNILLGIYRKKTTILGMLFMAVMLPLTLYIAIFNPVTDCGCFGDAIVIDNWSTFIKNIFFSAFAVILFIFRDDIVPVLGKKTRWMASGFAFLFMVLLSVYCYLHLPIIDFRPYKIGTNIPEKMEIPEGAPRDSFKTVFTYEKDGAKREFELKGMDVVDVKDGATYDFTEFAKEWKYVDMKSELVRKGYEPPIHDFSITLPDDGDITEEVLSDPNYTFLLIAYKLEKASTKKAPEINDIYSYALANGYKFYCLNASLTEEAEDYIAETGAQYPMAITDPITLKTIIRSNPGLVLIKDGIIINKWHYNDLPVFDKPLNESKLGEIPKPTAVKSTLLVALLFCVPVFVIIGLDRMLRRKKN